MLKCEKKNAVLCEKAQEWSNSQIKNILQDLRKNFTDKFTSQQNQFSTEIAQLKKEIVNFNQNSVPIGFIYVQLSGQKDPQTLWANTKWSNVSPNYAGLFFRAEGGNASSFGNIQVEQTQAIFVKEEALLKNSDYNVEHTISSTYDAKGLRTGDNQNASALHFSLNFRHSTDEIRPRNQAIRIWIRIK